MYAYDFYTSSFFFSDPLQTGAIVEFSQETLEVIVQISKKVQAKVMLELGCGEGLSTEMLISHLPQSCVFYGIEIHNDAACRLQAKYHTIPHIHILCGDAGDSDLIKDLYHSVDCIVSTLPLLSLSEQQCHDIMKHVSLLLSPDGIFIQAQYTPFRVELMQQYLDITRENIVLQNVPPAILYVGIKKKF